ncbi:MAG: DNA polymerase III subunit alpha [Lachnospiraceae bacterium]|nr:DNA polymerase III subunit alpha [Lachnospiraceae bacterium]
MAFVHLHTHTQYSLLDGSNKIDDYVARVKAFGMNAAAITDHGVMYGVIEFYKACQAAGIKPILGCEVYVAPGSRLDRETGENTGRYYHLILLAENDKGYENLTQLVSRGFTEGYYYKPRVDRELLAEYHEGLICLSACLAGEVAVRLTQGDYEGARKAARWYAETFGEEHYYLELQDHGIPEQKRVNSGLLRLHEELGLPLVATNDCHYTMPGDWEAHDALLCIQTAKKLSDTDRLRYAEGQFYVRSEEEMRALFPYAQEAIDNTQRIADRCEVTIEFGKRRIPRYDVPDGMDSWDYLNRLCEEGLRRCYPDEDTDREDHPLRERLRYELSVIRGMGFVDYFLIVWDYINYAKQHGIAVGPGRGSAAGSLVSYCLSITNIDPVANALLFERFLNPERVSMPDIDVDFEPAGRQAVIDYVTAKYGRDRVMQIITFGTLAARGVIRDVARVMDLPYAQGDQIAKMIPNELGITLERAMEINPDLKAAADSDPTIEKLLSYCRRLEGLPRHASVHAAGVVICSAPAMELVPLARAQDGSVTTQFPGPTIEELGLLKMDFLGLRNLTVIKDTVRSANEMNGKKPGDEGFIDIDRIDWNDPQAMDLIGSGRTDGVFQLESGGMQAFMKELKPRCFEDIVAGISLYRPGPMDFIPKYIAGKNDRSAITYETPALTPILEPTYGCIVYQEQVMQIVQRLAGYSLGRADLLRRAMSKKKQAVMEAERRNFIDGIPEENLPGCVGNGIPADVAGRIYDSMLDFAKYAFNKSHAACYAVVAIQTAWLKARYPVEFMAALMTSVIDATGKLSGYMAACRLMDISILPPDINEGGAAFLATRDAEGNKVIRYALTAVRGVGYNLIAAIEEERAERGPFRSLDDFCRRMAGSDLNRRSMESLIKAGAFDSLGGTRKQYLQEYIPSMEQAQQEAKDNITGQISLFDMFGAAVAEPNADVRRPVGEFEKGQLLAYEKEVLGVYVTGHPLESDIAFLKKHVGNDAADFAPDEETGEPVVPDNARVTIGGLITEKRIRYTKNNQAMAILQLEDLTGSVEVVVFPKCYDKCSEKLIEDGRILVKGRANWEADNGAKMIAEEIRLFSEVPRTVWVQFADRDAYAGGEETLLSILAQAREEAPGNSSCTVYLRGEKQKKSLTAPVGFAVSDALLTRLRSAFGADNIKVV